jgi:hypothetical protein
MRRFCSLGEIDRLGVHIQNIAVASVAVAGPHIASRVKSAQAHPFSTQMLVKGLKRLVHWIVGLQAHLAQDKANTMRFDCLIGSKQNIKVRALGIDLQ